MSVYKDKKRNTYYVSFSVKDPLTGKFRHKTKRGFKSVKDAKTWEAENRYVNINTDQTTFIEMAHKWEDYACASDSMREKHSQHFRYRFTSLVDKPIANITKDDLIQWQNALYRSDEHTTTKNDTIGYVRSVFNFANAMYNLPNPAIVLKRFKKTDEEIMHEMEVWTPEEFFTFIECVEDEPYKTFFEFLFWTGCRRGEAIALQKQNIKGEVVLIQYSQRYQKDGLQPTKTRRKRNIQLDKKLLEKVRHLIETNDGPYVFGGKRGLSPSAIDRRFKSAIEKSHVRPIRIHDLRHSHATWLINNGCNIVAVSKRLGHASIEQTLETYTHLLNDTDQRLMDTIDSFLSQAEENIQSASTDLKVVSGVRESAL